MKEKLLALVGKRVTVKTVEPFMEVTGPLRTDKDGFFIQFFTGEGCGYASVREETVSDIEYSPHRITILLATPRPS